MTLNNITSSSDRIDDRSSQGLVISYSEHPTCPKSEVSCGKPGQGQVVIDMLPDDILLQIFYFCRPLDEPGLPWLLLLPYWNKSWRMLTQVCRQWRTIVLGSPRRLDLRVLCTPTTPTRALLGIWPPFPISICSPQLHPALNERTVENLTAAVEHRDRTSQIYISNINGPGLERLIGAMHEPLPALTNFYIWSFDQSVPMLPETFLGGSAPNLQSFTLLGIPFPSFPKFILSATHIVYLSLLYTPDSGYISPDAMATSLAALPNLKFLGLGFRSPLYPPLRVDSPPFTPTVLPALASLSFRGATKYFENLLARTHIPLLKLLHIQFFKGLIFDDIPRTRELIYQAEGLRLLGHAWVMFDLKSIVIRLGLPTRIWLEILCEERDSQLSSLARVCRHHLPLASVEQLTICELNPCTSLHWHWQDDMDTSQWLALFHPFTAVRDLYVAKQLVPFVTAALRELAGERTMDMFPALTNLFLEGFRPPGLAQEAIKPFVFARQLSNHPIAIHSGPPPQTPWFSPRDRDV